MDYLKRSEELFEETVENRRHLHQTPELGLELPETTAFIMEKLTEMGYIRSGVEVALSLA